MKRSYSLLALSLLATTTAHGVEIYKQEGTSFRLDGQFRPMFEKTTGKATEFRDRGSRLDFLASQQLTETIKAIGKLRIAFNGGKPHAGIGDPRAAQLYAGFEHKGIGRLYFGRLATNGDAIMLGDWQLGGGGRNPLTASASSGVHFRSVEFSGIQLGADYIFGDAQSKIEQNRNLKHGYGVSLFFNHKFDDSLRLRMRAGFTRDNYDRYQFSAPDNTGTNATWVVNKANRDAWRVAAELKFNDVEVAYNYGELKDLQRAFFRSDKNVKEKRHFLAAKYFFTPKFASYAQYRHETRAANTNHGYTLGVDYRPTKNLITFVEFGRDRNIGNIHKRDGYVNKYYTGFRLLF